MAAVVTGIAQVDRLLKALAEQGAERIGKATVAKGVRIFAKGQKSKVPPQYKDMKRLIGSRVGKAKSGASKGNTTAKAGFGVGKKKTTKDASGQKSVGKAYLPGKKHGKRGVGISARNIHWITLGTIERHQKKTGKPTGKMPALLNTVIPEGTNSAMPEAKSVMVETARNALRLELAKQ